MLEANSNIYNKLLTLLTTILLSTIFLKLLTTPIMCILMGAIILLCLLINKRGLNNTISISIIFFLFIALLYQVIGNGESFKNYLLKSLYFLTGLLLTSTLNRITRKQQRFLLVCLLSLLAFSVLATFSILLIDPMAVRFYGYGVDEADMYMESTSLFGMYSYGVGETFSFMMPALLCFALGTKKNVIKFAILAMIVLGVITQYMAALTTSFFLSLVASVLILLLYIKELKIREILFLILLIIPLFVIIAPKLTSFENTAFMTKMDDIDHSLHSGQSTGQLQTRSDLYMQSIEVFLSNPILGLGNIETQTNSHGNRFVSMHTSILDYLGLYGLFALLLFNSWKKILYKGIGILPPRIQKIYKIPLFALLGLLLLKGPVTIGVNFFFSTFLLTLLYYNEYYRIQNY